ncbi:MAG TPA: ABC transporter permease [Thermoanaerobaculia bacterium]|nr:ABC transporter permease [Thermoanaerobaculia bacterium]
MSETREMVRLPRFPSARLAAAFLVIIGLAALFAPLLTSDPDRIDLRARLQPPGAEHWLGTDDLGRDLFARVIHGARISLLIGFTAALVSFCIGVTLGGFAGYFGGAADWIVSRVIEVVICFPFLFLLLAIVALIGPSVLTIILALGLTSWTNEARYVRAEVLRVRETEFAAAARAIGARSPRILFRHLLPNAIAPAIVSASFGVASAILLESAISFLGFGVPLPQASWGSILSSADEYIREAWWLVLFPGLAIFLTVSACHTLGERLREVLHPRG